VPTDPRVYANQRVLVIGKGNSAFEMASAIFDKAAMVHLASRGPLRLAWNTKHPGDVRGQHGAARSPGGRDGKDAAAAACRRR